MVRIFVGMKQKRINDKDKSDTGFCGLLNAVKNPTMNDLVYVARHSMSGDVK
jgi:hypothetical protein